LGVGGVAGRGAARLSSCLAGGGVVCNYGSMSGEDPTMPRGALTSGGQTLVGFILGRGLASRSAIEVHDLYADLGRQIVSGALPAAPVAKVYAIEEIKYALAHAQRGERGGRIRVAPNGPISVVRRTPWRASRSESMARARRCRSSPTRRCSTCCAMISS